MVSKETRAHIEILLVKYLDGKATPAEREMLAAYLEKEKDDAGWEEVIEELMMAEPEMEGYDKAEFEPIVQNILKEYKAKKVFHIKPVYRWVAAAVVMIAVAMGVWLTNNKGDKTEIAKIPQEQRFKNDVQPAKGQVTLTLADGSTIAVDKSNDGTITSQNGTSVVKDGNSITYDGKATAVAYNTITTQKGKVFSLELADGTRVWLDAMSSITFPTAFPGKDRVVEITGQAYFEVAKNKDQPFKVKTKNQTIEVLGTHFNVNAHAEEVTTLLEGSVRVQSTVDSRQLTVLKPGQQSIYRNQQFKLGADIDIDQVMAWKNGKFDFEGASIKEIMTNLERWYDIDVEVKENVPYQFVAKIKRDVPISEILKVLELTGRVHFVIDGKKVTVMN